MGYGSFLKKHFYNFLATFFYFYFIILKAFLQLFYNF